MNCKSGDLALVVASANEENIGLFVEVVEPYCGPIMLTENGRIWLCKAKGVIAYTNLFGGRFSVQEGPIPDWALRPLRLPDPSEVDEAERQHLIPA